MRTHKIIYHQSGEEPVELQYVSGGSVRTLNAKSNTAEVVIRSDSKILENGEIKFIPNETLTFYANNGLIDTSNPSHIIGTFLILNYELMPDTNQIKLYLKDKTYNMLSKIFVYKDVTNRTANYIINQILQVTNETGGKQNNVITDLAITRSDGSGFPLVDFISDRKTAYECITELSQPEITGDVNPYIFWFDENNVFHWQFPSTVLQNTVFEQKKLPVLEMKVTKAETETSAMIISNTGRDLEGKVHQTFNYNPNAKSIASAISYQPMTEIEKELRDRIKRQYGLADTENATLLTVITNAQFLQLMDDFSAIKSKRIFDGIGTGLWRATIRTRGINYSVGDLFTVISKKQGFQEQALRLTRVQHYFDKKGWFTSLTLEEDIS